MLKDVDWIAWKFVLAWLMPIIITDLWEGDLINLQQHPAVADGRAGAEIYIRLAASELELQIGNGSTRTGMALYI